MNKNASVVKIFAEQTGHNDEISPSVNIRRVRQLGDRSSDTCDLVYTEGVWAAINNTLAGCSKFGDWQQAERWILVTDDVCPEEATTMLGGCENLANAAATVMMVDSRGFSDALQALNPNTHAVVALAVSSDSLKKCAVQANKFFESSTESNTSQLHLLWFPNDRAAQTVPVDFYLESLAWTSLTIVCDLAKLSKKKEHTHDSLIMMLRVAVFIDAQFLHWIEGNLSALADHDEELHRKAIMRSAHTLFTKKQRRSEEPVLPTAFTDTVALRYTRAASEQTPNWQVKARQLLLDIRYAIAAGALTPSAEERIHRVMASLNLLAAAKDASTLISEEPVSTFVDESFLLLTDFGSARSTKEFVTKAWQEAI